MRKPKLTLLLLGLLLVGVGAIGASVGLGPQGLITGIGIVDPEVINPPGYGTPDSARLSFIIKGDITDARRLPLDLLLIVDRSATTDITRMHEAVAGVLALLGPNDRVGLISFADAAREDLPLIPLNEANKGLILRTVAGFINQGKTDCSGGMKLANQVLADEGGERRLWVEVLLTDGFCTHGHEPLPALREAAAAGIAPFVVGVGFVSQLFVERMGEFVAEEPGVRFFSAPARFLDFFDRRLAEIQGLAGLGLELRVTLPASIGYAGEPSEPPSAKTHTLKGKIYYWERDRLGLGESWNVAFKIVARKTGEFVPAEAELEFKNPLSGGPMPPVEIPVTPLRVRNVPPICDFSFEPTKPTIADDVNFYDHSYDPFGDMIVSWEWDFGDGTGSAVRNPTHRYAAAGNYLVTLRVTDSAGASCEASKTIEVGLVAAKAIRSLLTFPRQTLLPGLTYTATVRIEPQVQINGLGLKEFYPQGWTITPVENAGAEFKEPNEWIWQGPLAPGEVKQVEYNLTLPEGVPPGPYSTSGTLSSYAPRFELPVGGTTNVVVADHLELKVAVACLDTTTEQPDPAACYDEQGRAVISAAQIEKAKEYYRTGKPVPGSGGQVIDYNALLELLAYYQTGTPVTQPLPED